MLGEHRDDHSWVFRTLEKKFALGDPSVEHVDRYGRITGNLRRTLEAIGLQRRARTITDVTLKDLLRADAKQVEVAAESTPRPPR